MDRSTSPQAAHRDATAGPGPLAAPDLVQRIAETCSSVAAVPDLVVACGQLLPLLAEAADATRASLLLVNPRTGCLMIANAFGLPVHLTGQDLPYRPRSIAEWVLRNQRPLILNGEVKEERFEGSDRSIDCAMSLPIEGFDGPIGVVNLARPHPGEPFDDATMLVIARLLYPVGVAIERVHRMIVAESVYRQLLQPPAHWVNTLLPEGGFESRNYEFGYTRLPSARVCGDLCVRMPHPSGAQTLLAVDASSWGLRAAAMTGFTHGMFVATATPERSAVALAARLNAGLHGRVGPGHHVALWVAQLARNGQLAYCNAGMAPPLWVPNDDIPPRALSTGGPIAGPFPQPNYREETLQLLPGDLVVGASNGVLLAQDGAGEMFGPARLTELVTELRRGPLERLTRAVCEGVRHFTGRPLPHDDLSVWALRYTPGD